LERLAGYEIDGLFGHDAAILGFDVAYLRGDLLQNNGIESNLHLCGGSSTHHNNVSNTRGSQQRLLGLPSSGAWKAAAQDLAIIAALMQDEPF
jgi:hypothetical protein